MVAGYSEVSELLSDSRLSLDKRRSGGGYSGFALPPMLDRNLANMDGAEHSRVRSLAAPAFSRRSTEALREVVVRTTGAVFDELVTDSSGPIDLVERLCVPVPAMVIGDLLGLSAELREPMRDAANVMFTADMSDPDDVVRLRSVVGWMTTAFTEAVAAKRRTPGDDLLSGWVRARDEEGALTEEELVSLAFLMMLAGLENAVLLPANLIAALLTDARGQWPGQRKTLVERANPLPFAVRRFATTELTVGGATIAPGETVLLSLFAADSDPARGDRPSLMFGRGPHYCLGARVADLIVDAIVTELLARHPNARLAVEPAELRYRVSWRSHGLSSLPVLLGG